MFEAKGVEISLSLKFVGVSLLKESMKEIKWVLVWVLARKNAGRNILKGLSRELIKQQVSNMYLWPKALEVPILDPSKAMKKPVGNLHMKVVRAMKLKKKDLLGASDPYVKLKLTEDKLPSKKTTVKHRNLNPEWNEEFNMAVKDPESQALEIIVYDWEQVGKHDKMGMNVIPLKELTPDEPKVITLERAYT
ncbi:synaptotagmin-2-like [Carya illinoinensis]|nr:synaptotagmin-2-like [Carya illinoinensis]